MNTEITGTAHLIEDTQTFPSGFSKRVLVIKTEGEYPQTIPLEFIKDKCAILDGVATGQQVTAHINIRGNEYNGKYYANLQCWKLDKGQAEPPQGNKHKSNGAPLPQQNPMNETQRSEVEDLDKADDIPF